MSGEPEKSGALESLDLVISVLKEHEKDLDRLIKELAKIAEKMGGSAEKIEERLSDIRKEVSSLIEYLSSSRKPQANIYSPLLVVRCNQWDDFKNMAAGAEAVSFIFKESEGIFQVDALKDGRFLTYSGKPPRIERLLKAWISRELNTSEEKIFEGSLATG
jgi:hypothetical protein